MMLKIQLSITEIHKILKYINKENYFNHNISQYYCFYCIFDQINAALVSIRDFFQKHYKNLPTWSWCAFNVLLMCFFLFKWGDHHHSGEEHPYETARIPTTIAHGSSPLRDVHTWTAQTETNPGQEDCTDTVRSRVGGCHGQEPKMGRSRRDNRV